MVDHLVLAPNEEVRLDTTNNTITIVLCNDTSVQVSDPNGNVFVVLESAFELFTLSIQTGIYTAKNVGSSNANILVFRQFIY
jgi:hypothetical protein